MRIGIPVWLLGAVLVLLIVVSTSIRAQIKDSGPMTIVISYSSAPEKRAAFRSFMETKGVMQFEEWKRAGVFLDYQLLFSSFTGANPGNLDMAAILQFGSFVDVAKWKAVDRLMPGGLTSEGLALGHADRSTLAYPISRGEAPQRNPAGAAYVLGLYQVLVDAPSYTRYARAYVEPQVRGWLKEGAVTAYDMYLTQPGQNPETVPWTFLLILEYTDMEALAESDAVKNKVRVGLSENPDWKALAASKAATRKAKGFVFADAITAPQH